MRKKALFTTSLAVVSLFLLGLTACKKCDVGTDSTAGVIVTDVLLYPTSGNMTSSMAGDYHVHANSGFAPNFQMSLDGGTTRVPMNYNAYSILGYPTLVNCNASFEREVTIDDVNMITTYKIRVNQCKDAKCDEQRLIENFVMVPAFNPSYTVLYDVQVIEK